jgi:hypothetical protein
MKPVGPIQHFTRTELVSLKQNLLSVFRKTWIFFLLNVFAIFKVTSAQEAMSRVPVLFERESGLN